VVLCCGGYLCVSRVKDCVRAGMKGHLVVSLQVWNSSLYYFLALCRKYLEHLPLHLRAAVELRCELWGRCLACHSSVLNLSLSCGLWRLRRFFLEGETKLQCDCLPQNAAHAGSCQM